jgi:UDP-N-acetylmuramoyl-tripeptide--D-alanyl-D-alanine ligase
MKRLLQYLLKFLAKAMLARYHPRVVGVTGSVGKTGSRMAIAAVLRTRYRVSEPSKNLNNEIGLPLAILLEQDSGYRNLLAWSAIFFRAIKNLAVRNYSYPQVLVLEYGVDHIGDMDYLLSIVRPEVAVVTAISPTHLEFLGSVENVAREKGKLVTTLPESGAAVLNVDFPRAAMLATKTKAKVYRYGEDTTANVKASGISLSSDGTGAVQGMSFRLTIGGSTLPVLIRGSVGRPVVSMAMSAAAVGLAMGMNALDISKGLDTFVPPSGRLRLISGVKRTLLIDDTYNSSPEALSAACDVLRQVPVATGARRWAVLGDMLELGSDSESLHRTAGDELRAAGVDYLVTVGERSRDIARGALAAGLPAERTWHVDKSSEAGRTVQARLKFADVVLVKGSQGVRMERVVKELMAEPERAKELLVRQGAPWV